MKSLSVFLVRIFKIMITFHSFSIFCIKIHIVYHDYQNMVREDSKDMYIQLTGGHEILCLGLDSCLWSEVSNLTNS